MRELNNFALVNAFPLLFSMPGFWSRIGSGISIAAWEYRVKPSGSLTDPGLSLTGDDLISMTKVSHPCQTRKSLVRLALDHCQ